MFFRFETGSLHDSKRLTYVSHKVTKRFSATDFLSPKNKKLLGIGKDNVTRKSPKLCTFHGVLQNL